MLGEWLNERKRAGVSDLAMPAEMKREATLATTMPIIKKMPETL
jgi:hypothetical protein